MTFHFATTFTCLLFLPSLGKKIPPGCSFQTTFSPSPISVSTSSPGPPLCQRVHICNPIQQSQYLFKIIKNRCKPSQKLFGVKLPLPCLILPPFFCLTAKHSTVIFEQYNSAFLVHFFNHCKRQDLEMDGLTFWSGRTNLLFLCAYKDFRSEKHLIWNPCTQSMIF